MRSAITAAVAFAVVTLAGCSSYDSVTQRIAQSITPYRITVVQGNFVSQEKASQLRAGMTREQVRALLGTPLLADMFHADRWDYLFYFKRGSTSVVQQRDLVVHFQNDVVSSWSGGENLPSELDLLADIDGDRHRKTAPAVKPAAASAAVAASASVAAPAPAASAAPDMAPAPVTEPPASAAGQSDANSEAARAANRATAQVPNQGTQGRRFSPASPAAPSAPTPGGMPPGASPAVQPQFQFHRPPAPAAPSDGTQPVGPRSTDTLPNQPLTSPPADISAPPNSN